MKKILLLLFILFTYSCFAQKYINKYDQFLLEKDKAEILYINNQFNDAIVAFDKVLEKYDKSKFHIDIYFEKAECYFKLNNSIKAIDVLKESVKYGAAKDYFDNGYLIGDSLCQLAWENIRPEYISLRKEYYSNLENPDVYLEVEKLVVIDQLGRKYPDLEEAIDKENIEKFIEIVREHGWQQNGWVLLWHHRDSYKQDNQVWNFFTPFFEKEIEKGHLPKGFLSWYEDNYAREKTGFTVYGAMPGPVNKETVNVKRREINLKPLTKEQIDQLNR